MQGVTYRQEIEAARDRLRSTARAATDAPWEKVVDRHQRGVRTHSVWSEKRDRYVAEVTDTEEDARYIQLMDSLSGLMVADLMTSFLETCDDDLDASSGHEECNAADCQIAAFMTLAFRINGMNP
jgi:hypothetical protein